MFRLRHPRLQKLCIKFTLLLLLLLLCFIVGHGIAVTHAATSLATDTPTPTMTTTSTPTRSIKFKIAYENGRYNVYMRADNVPTDYTLTGQFTLKVPHATADDRFTVVDEVNPIADTRWDIAGRSNAPPEAPEYNYISYYLQFPAPAMNRQAIAWSTNQEFLVFSFANGGACSGPVELIDNATDPFMYPNSQNLNVGNTMVVFIDGDMEEVYTGRYDVGSADCSATPTATSTPTPSIKFKIAYENGRYNVYMRSDNVPTDYTLTGQFTLKVPHATADDRFTVVDEVNPIADTRWDIAGRSNAPPEAPDYDYISYYLQFPAPAMNRQAIPWSTNQTFLVFSFANGGACAGPVELIDNATDPFMFPNSQNLNVGNTMVVFHGGDMIEAYTERYDVGAADCSLTIPATNTPTVVATVSATSTATQTPTDTATHTPGPIATPTTPVATPPLSTATPTDTVTPTPAPTTTATATASVPTPTQAVVGPDLTMAHLEFTQSIQTMLNSTPLIANKPLLARMTVGVNNFGGALANVTGELRAFRDGVELAGSPLAPLSMRSIFLAKENPVRTQLADTLNFVFPANWLAAGPLTIQATVNPHQAVAESSYANNTQSYQLTFHAVDPLQIVLVPIAFQPNGQGEIYRPLLNAITQYGLGYLADLYPIPGVQFTVHSEYLFTGNLYTTAGWSALLAEIRQLRNSELADPNAPFPKYYGVVAVAPGCCYPGTLTPKPPVGGMSYALGGVAVGLETTAMIIDYDGDNQSDPGFANPYLTLQEHIAAHELGHTFGLGYAPCGTTGDPGFPHPTAEIENVGFYLPAMNLVTPAHKDVMSYCFLTQTPSQWISAYNYERLYAAITTAQATTAQVMTAQALTAETGWLIAGEIRNNGATGSLYNTAPLSATTTVQEGGAGAYAVRIVDADGQLLFRYAFTPELMKGKQADESKNNISPPNIELLAAAHTFPTTFAAAQTATDDDSSFSFILPYRAAAAYIQLWHEELMLDQLPVAVNPPLLNATFVDTGDTLVLSWRATDSNPSDPQVMVRYSADRGATWQTLAHNLPATALSYRVDKDQLMHSAAGLLAVIAGNSTRRTYVQLEIGAIANKAPQAHIIQVTDRPYEPGESILLFATALDFEDGTLAPEHFTWTIDELDRAAVIGAQYTLLDGLPAGVYTIRLTVTDRDGSQATETSTVTVNGYNLYLPYVQR